MFKRPLAQRLERAAISHPMADAVDRQRIEWRVQARLEPEARAGPVGDPLETGAEDL